MNKKNKLKKQYLIKLLLSGLIVFFIFSGVSTIWAITLPVPDFESFFQQQIDEKSTRIYDRTGNVLLYDVRGIRRTPVPFEEIPDNIKKATIAIEDSSFYDHKGIKLTSIARALIADIASGKLNQGGSTITQQVVKNSLLTKEKTISRKVKEMVLAIKMEKTIPKDEILNIYLNESPYGGNIYGIKEAVKAYYKKELNQVTIAEAAYLAAIPQAPSFYSPYGKNKEALDKRKNLVLSRMREVGFITKEQEKQAKEEKVVFYEKINQGIKAPHFVFYIIKQLEEKYGAEEIQNKGFKVITTIDWEIQQKTEEITKKYGEENWQKFKAQNNSVVIIDPKTGQILTMVGSRDYFNEEIQGSFNVATAHRQPGSSFKPFVYATAFNKGYTDKTIVFDLKTQFDTNCSPTGTPLVSGAKCYTPSNYDDKFVGPISLRDALAQSRNIPAIKVLYLAGINDSLEMAKKLGINSLGDKKRYGLTLVLGGGEVSLLEMTSAYSVFANDGIKNDHTGILKIEDPKGRTLEEYKPKNNRVLPENTSRLISDILSDNSARLPSYGANSPLNFSDKQVAVKTGTTNDYKDTWIIGYTPNLTVGAWVGNNDNTPMDKKLAGMVVSPMWRAIMNEVLKTLPEERFIPPSIDYSNLKPILRGYWQGGEVQLINNTNNSNYINGQTEYLSYNPHSILYWVDKNNPNGPRPSNPNNDPQFKLWEYPVVNWATNNGYYNNQQMIIGEKGEYNPNLINSISFISPNANLSYKSNESVTISLIIPPEIKTSRVDYYLNNNLIGSSKINPFVFSFIPEKIEFGGLDNELKAVIFDSNNKTISKITKLNIN